MRKRKAIGTIRDRTDHFHALKESMSVKSNSSGSTASSKNQKREQRYEFLNNRFKVKNKSILKFIDDDLRSDMEQPKKDID